MNLTINRKNENEFYCEITDELDRITGIQPKEDSNYWRHYIVEDKYTTGERGLAIRVPGGTTGGVWIDEDGVITEILISSEPSVNIYPKDINELLKKFIGTKFENYESKKKCSSSKVWEILNKSYYTEEGIKEIEEQYIFLVGITGILGTESTKKLASLFDCHFKETYKILCETTGLTAVDKKKTECNAVNIILEAGKKSNI